MGYISTFCVIRQRSIYRDNKQLIDCPVESLADFLGMAYDKLNIHYPKFYKMDNMSKLGILASEVILTQQQLKDYNNAEIAIVLSNSQSSLDSDIRYQNSLKTIPSPALFVYTLPNIVTGEICIRNGFKGENAFFITPQFNPDLIFNYVNMLLVHSNAAACIAGWIDILGEHHDVLLYLIEKDKRGLGLTHSAEQLRKLYLSEYGTIDG